MPVPNEDQVTYLDQSELDTGDIAIIENVFNGYSVVSGGAVTAQGSPDGTVAVASGVAKVAGASVTITAGNVSVISGSANADSTTATAADATLARFSLITINSSGQLGVVHGAAAALSPNNDGSYLCVFPTFAGKTVLASVFVPPTFTTIATGQLSDKRILRTDGDLSARVISPTALSAAVDNYAPTGIATANVIRLSTNSGTQRNISGIVPTGHADGGFVILHNLGPGAIGLLDDVTSTAANRFALAGDIVLPVDKSVILQYDPTSSRWRAASGMTIASAPTAAVGTAAAAGTSPYALGADATIAHEPAHINHDTTWAAKGDIIAATANDTAAVVTVGTNRQVLAADSTATPGVAWKDTLVASLTAATGAIANTETVVVGATIKANTLAAGDSFLIYAQGFGTTSTSPGTGTWRIRFAPTTLTTSLTFVSAAFTASRTTKPFVVNFGLNVFSIGGTGTIMGEGNGQAIATTNDLFAISPTMSSTVAAVTVDTTVDNLLELSFQSGAASASTITYVAYIRKL